MSASVQKKGLFQSEFWPACSWVGYMDVSNCLQLLPPFFRLVLDFFLFYTATCTHSCLKSLYFIPLLNSHKEVFMTCKCLQTVLFLLFSQSVLKGAKYRQRLYKINCVFFASFPSPIWFLASLQTFPLTVHAHRLYQVPNKTKTRKGDNG